MYVFVYGTLKSGQRNNRLLQAHDARFVGVAWTGSSKFYMTTNGGFPYLMRDTSDGFHVEGEVWEVNARALADLDRLEGYERGRDHNHYDRTRVRVVMSGGERLRPWVYIASESVASHARNLKECPLSDDGAWVF